MEIRAYADRIELRQDGRVVGDHRRCFGRDQTVFDPWHYVPVLARKPGALRNGAPFKDWVLPAGLERVRRKLAGAADGDRQMVNILTTVLSDGLPAVEAACLEALREGVHSADVIINILARRREPEPPVTITTPDALRLRHAPAADCDAIRQPQEGPLMERSEILATMGELKLYGMKAAFDEIIATAVKRQHEPQRVVGDLLTAEISEKQARSIKYQITIAKLPLAKDIDEFASTARRSTRPWCAISSAATSWRISATSCWSAGPAPESPSRHRNRPRVHPRRRQRPVLQCRRSGQQT